MPTTDEILRTLSAVLEILKDGPTPLSHPPDTPRGRAYYALSSLYIQMIMDRL